MEADPAARAESVAQHSTVAPEGAPETDLTSDADRGARSRRHLSAALWHLVALAPFLVLTRYLDRRAALDEDAYRRPVIIWEWLTSLPLLEVLIIALLVAALAWFRDLMEPWSAWDDGATLRFVVGMTASALAWWFATSDVNLFLGRTHLVDRLLLVALAAAVWWRPVFVLPFLVVLVTFDAQFRLPLDRHSVAQISLPANLLFLFAAAFLVQVVVRRAMARHFVFLMFCMIAASYLVPGLGKLRLGWLSHRDVHLALFSSHSVGWLGTTSASTIVTIGRWMEVLEWPIVIGTVAVECGAVVLLLRRSTAIVWLGLFDTLNTMMVLNEYLYRR